MNHTFIETPLGAMMAVAESGKEKDALALTRLDFVENVKRINAPEGSLLENTPLFDDLRLWLADYFSGELGKKGEKEKRPEFSLPLKTRGTAFQSAVWALLLEIPYGKTTTYGALAKQIAQSRGISTMSAQAIGGAVGSNPISILIPCHRVIGAGGGLTGYASGLARKRALLELEGYFF
jgi:methylated-DNA-[protein]-cysteine S-methyltransferase